MLRMVPVVGCLRLSRGLSDMGEPRFLPGFSFLFWLVRVGRCGRGVRLVVMVSDVV